jgi:hypothetical protein
MGRNPSIVLVLAFAGSVSLAPAMAQGSAEVAAPVPALAKSPAPPPPGGEAQDLAKKLANPVASLISVPFQENIDFGGGPGDKGAKSTLNIQPVVPISLGKMNLIVRTILPIVYQRNIAGLSSDQWGLGDTTQSFFFSPVTKPGDIIWAIGPVGYYPTATDHRLGSEKWGAGVTGLLLKQNGPHTFGLLTNQIWSIAGTPDRPGISVLFLQPFYSHSNKHGLTVGLNSETTYDWKRDQWTIPLNVTVTQLAAIGQQHVSFGAGLRYYAEKPAGSPDWGVRLIFTLLFPK